MASLTQDEAAARVSVSDTFRPGAKEIVTAYRVLSCDNGTAALEVRLITGRTHQIRAHMAHIGHPILGDEKYGDFAFNRSQNAKVLYLCAVRVTFRFEKGSLLSYLNGKSLAVVPPFET